MAARLLGYTDPRLFLHMAEAKLDDPLTRSAIRFLDDLLLSRKDQAVAAPSFGFPVRLIAVRMGDQQHYLLNPRLSVARDIRTNWGETNPHTGQMCRNVSRAHSIEVTATNLTGQLEQVTLENQLAISVQQAFDIFDRPNAFDWMTGFHRSWSRAPNQTAIMRFTNLTKGLFSVPQATSDAAADSPLIFVSINEVEARDDTPDRKAVARIDVRNPLIPVSMTDRMAMAALFGISRLQQILIRTPRSFGMAVSALATVLHLTVHYRQEGWPEQAGTSLGLSGAMHPFRGNLMNAGRDDQGHKFDAIIMDMDDPYLADTADQKVFHGLSKSLVGAVSPLIILGSEKSAWIEDRLLSSFPAAYQLDVPDGGVIYIGIKGRINFDTVYSRLIAVENMTSSNELIGMLAQGWHMLNKSGERQPL
ncbi:MAG: peptide deformylase [Paracoccus sp. (in: a-proteobacteria)]